MYSYPGLIGTLDRSCSPTSAGTAAPPLATGSYSLAWDFITRSPFFLAGGSGLSFRRIASLDNQYLGTTIDMGFVGVPSRCWGCS